MILGINAFNIRSGGGVGHLIEMLSAADPKKYGFSRVIVWGNQSLEKSIPKRSWLEVRTAIKEGDSWFKKISWLLAKFNSEVKFCDLLYVPGGCYLGSFRPFISYHQNVLPFSPKEKRRYLFSSPKLFMKWNILKLVQEITLKNSQGRLFPTKYAQEIIRKGGKSNDFSQDKVIYHGVNEAFHKIGDGIDKEFPRKIRLLYVSTIDMYKHQWHVVKAVKKLRDKKYDISLEFIGGVGNSKAYKKLLSSISQFDPAGEFVFYKGEINYKDLPSVYSGANIFIFASSCESFSNVILEGMASGLPIACSKQGAMPELLKDAGVYFDPEQPEDIAGAVENLITNQDLRLQCGHKASEYSQDYSWKKCADETFDYFQKVIEAEGAR